VRWQGRCREAFLREHAPEMLREMGYSLMLATTRVACFYYRELDHLDEVAVRMRAANMTSSRLTMSFSYFRAGPGNFEELVAEGSKKLSACSVSKDE
jgi:enediyne biosynthesis thioesterase